MWFTNPETDCADYFCIYLAILKAKSYLAQLCAQVAAFIVFIARRMWKTTREWSFSVCVNIFGMTDEKIIETYWLSVNAIFQHLRELRADLEPVTRRSLAVSSMAKLLCTLHLLFHYPWWKLLTRAKSSFKKGGLDHFCTWSQLHRSYQASSWLQILTWCWFQ